VGEGFNLSLKFRIPENLTVRVMTPSDYCEPAPHLLLDRHNGHSFDCTANFQSSCKALSWDRVALQLGKVVCVKNQQFL